MPGDHVARGRSLAAGPRIPGARLQFGDTASNEHLEIGNRHSQRGHRRPPHPTGSQTRCHILRRKILHAPSPHSRSAHAITAARLANRTRYPPLSTALHRSTRWRAVEVAGRREREQFDCGAGPQGLEVLRRPRLRDRSGRARHRHVAAAGPAGDHGRQTRRRAAIRHGMTGMRTPRSSSDFGPSRPWSTRVPGRRRGWHACRGGRSRCTAGKSCASIYAVQMACAAVTGLDNRPS